MTHILVKDPAELVLPPGYLAIDTEFHSEKRYIPRLHLIQVRGEEGPAYLIDPHIPGLLEEVAGPLNSHPWILHAGRVDLLLLQLALGAVPEQVLDTQICAGLIAPTYPDGLARLCADRLDRPLDKGQTLSDWAKRPLSPDQLRYAANDVANLHALWNNLHAEAQDRGRASVVLAACTSARADALTENAPELAWLSLPGRQGLRAERAVVLQDLAAWRERLARELNQPPGSILNNRVLFDLAKRRPTTHEALLAGRRAPRSSLSRHADILLERIAIATSLPKHEQPRTIEKGSLSDARLSWLNAWATIHATTERWSTRLVLPSRALERIAMGEDPDEVLAPWQAELAGHRLRQDLVSEEGLRCPGIAEKEFS